MPDVINEGTVMFWIRADPDRPRVFTVVVTWSTSEVAVFLDGRPAQKVPAWPCAARHARPARWFLRALDAPH